VYPNVFEVVTEPRFEERPGRRRQRPAADAGGIDVAFDVWRDGGGRDGRRHTVSEEGCSDVVPSGDRRRYVLGLPFVPSGRLRTGLLRVRSGSCGKQALHRPVAVGPLQRHERMRSVPPPVGPPASPSVSSGGFLRISPLSLV
jgi:hypothetical protein